MSDYNKGYEKLEAVEKEIAYLKERYSDALERKKQLLAQLSLLQPNDFICAGWTNFRPINPPAPPTDKEQK